MLSTVLAAVSLLSARGVIGAEYKIRNANEFVTFANNVNSGKNYKGTTVLLESDIVFTDKLSEQFTPVGSSGIHYFIGTFDGQGYKISNLKVKTYQFELVGLFGFSTGLTIRNVVIDDTCYFSGAHISEVGLNMGSLIAHCLARDGPCVLENSVNMAPVTFSGKLHLYVAELFLGGLAGQLVSYNRISVSNCANYGDVKDYGESDMTNIGGLFGQAFEYYYNTNVIPIKNCVNYGTVTYFGATYISTWFFVGGLVGYAQACNIENCANFGTVKNIIQVNCTGSIAGYASETTLAYSYWNGKSPFEACGRASRTSLRECAKFAEDTYKLARAVTVGSYKGDSLLGALNAYVDSNSKAAYSHWATNKGGHAVTFTVNGEKRIVLSARMMILPNLAKEGKRAFSGWYTDSACKNLLKNYEIGTATSLYGKFK